MACGIELAAIDGIGRIRCHRTRCDAFNLVAAHVDVALFDGDVLMAAVASLDGKATVVNSRVAHCHNVRPINISLLSTLYLIVRTTAFLVNVSGSGSTRNEKKQKSSIFSFCLIDFLTFMDIMIIELSCSLLLHATYALRKEVLVWEMKNIRRRSSKRSRQRSR